MNINHFEELYSMAWEENFVSKAPEVKLVNMELIDTSEIANPGFNLAVAAARSCYSGDLVNPQDIVNGNQEMADRISKSIWVARHHTPFMHHNYVFRIEGISRQALWSFFHSHPF